jgi:hypothetical protein
MTKLVPVKINVSIMSDCPCRCRTLPIIKVDATAKASPIYLSPLGQLQGLHDAPADSRVRVSMRRTCLQSYLRQIATATAVAYGYVAPSSLRSRSDGMPSRQRGRMNRAGGATDCVSCLRNSEKALEEMLGC